MGQSRPLFVYFCPFLITISILQIEKSIDGVLGIRTCSCMMVGADGNHGAMAAATLKIEYYPNGSQYLPNSLPTRRVHEQKLSMTKPSKKPFISIKWLRSLRTFISPKDDYALSTENNFLEIRFFSLSFFAVKETKFLLTGVAVRSRNERSESFFKNFQNKFCPKLNYDTRKYVSLRQRSTLCSSEIKHKNELKRASLAH